MQRNQNLGRELIDWYNRNDFSIIGKPTAWKSHLENRNAGVSMIAAKKQTSAVVND